MSLRHPPLVDPDGVTFRFATDRRLFAVDLVQEVGHPRSLPMTEESPGEWQVRFPRPQVDRFEYLLELTSPDGSSELVPDPANPSRAPGAFGEKSVVEFPGYRPPAWLDRASGSPPGSIQELELDSSILGVRLPIRLWNSDGARPDEPLPLLLVHDGFEYEQFSQLLDFLRVLTGDDELPPMRAALLHPVGRDDHYSACGPYADALAHEVLPFLHATAPVASGRRMRVGMGASLGALAVLHAHRTRPATFGGLFLQSGSFFHQRYFREQLGFEHFTRIRRFMDRVFAERTWDGAVPVAVTCGHVELNFPNNRATSLVLRQQGYPVDFRPVRDAHNWIGWRDAWTPSLQQLLRRLWT